MLYPPNPPGNVDNFPEQITLPDDGTQLEAADLNVAIEALADRTAYLKAHGFIDAYSFVIDTESVWPNVIIEKFSTTGSAYANSAIVRVDVPNCEVDDVVLVDFAGGVAFTGTNANSFGRLRMGATQGQGGNSPSTSNVAGAYMLYQNSGSVAYPSVSFTGEVRITVAGTLRVFMRAMTTLPADKLELIHAAKIRAIRMRRF